VFAAAASGAPALIAATDLDAEVLALAARDGFSGALVGDTALSEAALRTFA
jgi:hypothetical protein